MRTHFGETGIDIHGIHILPHLDTIVCPVACQGKSTDSCKCCVKQALSCAINVIMHRQDYKLPIRKHMHVQSGVDRTSTTVMCQAKQKTKDKVSTRVMTSCIIAEMQSQLPGLVGE